MKSKISIWFPVVAAAFAAAGTAQAVVVTPADLGSVGDLNTWYRNEYRTTPAYTSTTVGEINTTYPRSGNGSVEMSSTDGSGKVDFEYIWGYDASKTLGNLSALSYDWYRSSSSTVADHIVPSLRLIYDADGDISTTDDIGYLVYEPVYNGVASVTEDAWVSDDILDANFWMRVTSPPTSKTIEVFNKTLSSWQTSGVSDLDADLLSANSLIIGLNSGIGSGWNGIFAGGIDNVTIGFGTAGATTWNFEVATPDGGSTAMLIGLGVLALAGVQLRTRKA